MEELLKRLCNKSDDILKIIEYIPEKEQFNYLFVNDSIKNIFGVAKEEYLTNSKTWENLLHPEDKDSVLDWVYNATYPKDKRYRIIQPNGKVKLVHDNAWKIKHLGKEYILVRIKEV